MSDELLYNTVHGGGYELPQILLIDMTTDWLRSPIAVLLAPPAGEISGKK